MSLGPGARLGPFEIVAPLGAGGMGEVYCAHDTRLKRTVAIKVIAQPDREGPDRQRLDRFQQEARAIARINHPGICALHDVGQDGETTFLVMEFVEGETLEHRLAGGAMPLPLALRTAVQIAEALDHAHRQGVTHRDLKPANIMLTRAGVKILDFGLAKLRQEPADAMAATLTSTVPRLTEAGVIVGTVPYMSPEQIEGRPTDARSDIFSFGVVLYEMVTGRRPFSGDSRASLMNAIVSSEPAPPSSLQPISPATLDRVIARCLAKDPDARWQDTRDLAAELQWLSEAGSGSVSAAKTVPAARRRSTRTAIIASLAGAGLGAAAVALALMPGRTDSAAPAFVPVTFQRGLVTAARFAADGRSIVYSGSWNGGPHDVFVGQAGTADTRSLEYTGGRILSVSRTNELALRFGSQMVSPERGTLVRAPLNGGAQRPLHESILEADWIPDTDTLALVRAVGQAPNARAQLEFPDGTVVHEARAIWSLRVSPDGTRVAFFEGNGIFSTSSPGTLVVLDRSGQKSTLAHDLVALGLAWAPSGQEVFYTASTGLHAPMLFGATLSGAVREIYAAPDWLVVHDVATDGRVLMTRNSIRISMSCQTPDQPEQDLTWLFSSAVRGISRDGESVVFTETLGFEPGNPRVYGRPTRGGPAILLGAGTPLALSPDGKRVLMGGKNGLSLLPTGAGTTVNLPKGPIARVNEAAWLDDSRIVFFGEEDGAPRRLRWFVQSVPDGSPLEITREGVGLAVDASLPDGQYLLGNTKAGWQIYPIAGGESRPLPALTANDQPLVWSGDGRSIFVRERTGPRVTSVRVFRVEAATGRRELWRTLAPSDPVGIDFIAPVVIAPDAGVSCYSSMRRLGDLFMVTGLK
jgi:predicted Ser/Thr protein kinase